MGVTTVIVSFIIALSLGMWLGAMVFFSFVVAPSIFRCIDESSAGRIVRGIFPHYYLSAVGCGIIAFFGGVAWGVLTDFGWFLGIFFLFLLVALTGMASSRWVLIPRMESIGDNGFATYHRLFVGINLLGIVCVLIALFLSFWVVR